MDSKARAIIAHLTLIGWVLALIIDKDYRDEFAYFYLRQALGLNLMFILFNAINPFQILNVVVIIFWLLSIIAAAQNQIRETPLVGEYFQKWFKGL